MISVKKNSALKSLMDLLKGIEIILSIPRELISDNFSSLVENALLFSKVNISGLIPFLNDSDFSLSKCKY